MKKHLKIMLLVLIVGFLTTGCMEEKVSMVINNDKSMDFSMYVSLDLKSLQSFANGFGESNEVMTDEEYLNCIDENDGDETNCIAPGSTSSSDFDIDDFKDSIDESEIKELEEKGYTVTQNVTSDKYELQVSKKYNNIDEVSSNEDVTYNLDISNQQTIENPKFFKMEKGLLENKYTFHMINDSQNIDNSDSSFNFDTGNIDSSILSSMVDMTFQITLPNESISNNANSISNDKKTLTWDLAANENKEISVTFALPNENKNLIIYGGIGIGVLLVLIILIVVISKNKKKKVNTSNEVNQVQNSVMPNQQAVNQNIGGQVIDQTMNNGTISLENTNQASNETVASIVEQPLELNSSLEQPSVSSLPVESQVVASPVEKTTSVTSEEQPTNMQASSPSVNEINSDLQNVALDILNHKNND